MVRRFSRAMSASAWVSLIGMAWQVEAQQYSIAPTPYQTVLNNNGDKVSNACVWTYQAGTTTPIVTYTDTSGTVNSNPIRTDSAGRFTAYLVPGTGYKFTYELPCTPPGHGTVLRTADNITGTPATSGNVDTTGVAGETLTAGQVVYLSDGSGARVAGQWYKADAAVVYSSTLPPIGIVPGNVVSGATGAVRIYGLVTGLTGLSPGIAYYVGTAGAMTLTPPTLSRVVGVAQSPTTLILSANPSPSTFSLTTDNGVDDFRLTLTPGVPVTAADVTAATTLYLSPYTGNRIALYDATGQPVTLVSAEVSIALPATVSQLYDVFAYNNAGVPALELLAWTNDTTRATAIVRTTTGAWTKSGDLTRRYLGSVRTTTVSGQTEDSATKRYLWNVANRVPRVLQRYETAVSWAYTLATVRQANGNALNQVEVVIGVAEVVLSLSLSVQMNNSSGTTVASFGIGEDSTTTYTVGDTILSASMTRHGATQTLNKYAPLGRHFYSWNEWGGGGATSTWYGAEVAVGSAITRGLSGRIDG